MGKYSVSKIDNTPPELDEFESAQYYLADLEHYGKALGTKVEHRFISTDSNNKIVGTLVLILQNNVAYIDTLLVHNEKRGEGIGRQLVEEAESFSKKEGCTKIWLDTVQGWGAEAFYKKLGYEITGKHEKHIFGYTELIFTKFLTS